MLELPGRDVQAAFMKVLQRAVVNSGCKWRSRRSHQIKRRCRENPNGNLRTEKYDNSKWSEKAHWTGSIAQRKDKWKQPVNVRRECKVSSLNNRDKTDGGEAARDMQDSNRRSHIPSPESQENGGKRAGLKKRSEKPFPIFNQKTQTCRFRRVKTRPRVLSSVCGQWLSQLLETLVIPPSYPPVLLWKDLAFCLLFLMTEILLPYLRRGYISQHFQ